MSIDGVNGRTSYIGTSIVNLRNQLNDLTTQLASGKSAITYAGQGPDRGFALSLRAQVSTVDAYSDTANNVNTRINVANLALQGLSDLGNSVKNAAYTSTIVLDDNGQTSGQVTAQAAFSNAVSLLNSQSGDRFLFSGRATDTTATVPADVMLNGIGAQAGLKQLISERLLADQGTANMGRLTVSSPPATTTVTSIAEDGSPFGFKLGAITSSLTGATVTQAAGAPPSATIDLGATNPKDGDKITFNLKLPDGSTEPITLTATTTNPPPAGSFLIGANTAATTTNLQATLTSSIQTLSDTSLVAASAIAASDNFFDSSPPLRVGGPPFATATGLVPGTSANTVSWYTGESGTDPARGTAVARVDQAITVQYGARANEQALRYQLQNIAVYAAVTTDASNPHANAQISALQQRIAENLAPQAGQQSIQDMQAQFAGAQAAIKASTDRQTQVKGMAQSMLDSIEGINQDEVATKILALQTSLQASYQTTAMLYQTTLTKFLPIG
jgi:hypothetical protein